MLPDGRRLGAHLPLAPAWSRPSTGRTRSARARSRSSRTTRPPGVVARPIAPSCRRSASAPERRYPTRVDPRLVSRQPGRPGAAPSNGRSRCSRPSSPRRRVRRRVRERPHRVASRGRSDAGIARLAEGIGRVLGAAECDAGGRRGSSSRTPRAAAGGLGTNVEELAAIAEALAATASTARASAFCLDVAHAWGAGIDVGDPAAIDAFLDAFDARIGLERLVMIHLNDSRSERGSRTDRHEHLGAGRIGAPGWPTSSATRAWPTSRTSSRRPGMDEGYDAINLARARPAGGRQRLPTAAAARRSSSRAAHEDGAGVEAIAPTRPVGADRRRRAAAARSIVSSCSRSWSLAALLRLPEPGDARARGTPTRATTCSSCASFVRDGIVPLLGPPTSIGDVHHGAWYYYLLAPAAALDRRRLAARGRRGHRAGRDRGGRRRRGGWLARSAARSRASSPGSPWRSRPPRSTNRRSSGTRTSSRCRARSPSPARGGPGPAATVAGGWWRPSGRRSRCSATSSASRCCPSSLRCSSLDARRRRLGSVWIGVVAIVVLAYLPLVSTSSRRATPRREPRPTTSRATVRERDVALPDPLRRSSCFAS